MHSHKRYSPSPDVLLILFHSLLEVLRLYEIYSGRQKRHFLLGFSMITLSSKDEKKKRNNRPLCIIMQLNSEVCVVEIVFVVLTKRK